MLLIYENKKVVLYENYCTYICNARLNCKTQFLTCTYTYVKVPNIEY